MFSGFYTAASGILMQQRTLDVLSNNIANSKTPGYRAERVTSSTFEHELLTRIEQGNTQQIGSGTPIRIIREVPTNFEVSAYEQTGRPFDLAIKGEGFFNIQTAAQQNEEGQETAPAQTLLTRNGNFNIDSEGYLVLDGVGRVLGSKGEIQVNGSGFAVYNDGEVYNNKGKRVDTLLVTQPSAEANTTKMANGLYSIDNPELNRNVVDKELIQGVLERSNIDVNREISLAMEAQRAFQTCSQALKIVDAMNQKASTQIASL